MKRVRMTLLGLALLRVRDWDCLASLVSPSKMLKNGKHLGGTNPARCTTLPGPGNITAPPPSSSLQDCSEMFENCEEAHPNMKVPAVRVKKWVRKKNGLFGWVNSIVPSQGRSRDPQNIKGLGV